MGFIFLKKFAASSVVYENSAILCCCEFLKGVKMTHCVMCWMICWPGLLTFQTLDTTLCLK